MSKTKCALFIDCENISASLFEQIISKLDEYQVCSKRAYANWRLGSPWSDILDHYGIEPVQVFHKGLKNSSDLRLSLDCLQMAYERADISCFALVTSDSDFRHLVFKLLDLGKKVLGFGESKSDVDFMGIYSQFFALKPEQKNEEKTPNLKIKELEKNVIKEIIWLCLSNNESISINKVNGKMLSLYGKKWNLKNLGFSSWSAFLKSNAGIFDLAYDDEAKRIGMKIKLKEAALFKL